MGKKRNNPKVTVEIVVRPEVEEKQEEALRALVSMLSVRSPPNAWARP